MSLRIFSLTNLACALAACGGNASQAPEGAKVDCAIGPGSELSNVCTLERVSTEIIVIHHPDGGFRRFRIGDDPAAPITVADGALALTTLALDEATKTLEFGLGTDRYRISVDLIANTPDE